MPYLQVRTNVEISERQEQRLTAAFAGDITLLPGKSEQWLMCGFEDHCRLWFQGKDTPCALVEVQLFGAASAAAYEALTAALTDHLCKELSLPSNRVYVRYGETNTWGFNGRNF